jgi:hypothetical protein
MFHMMNGSGPFGGRGLFRRGISPVGWLLLIPGILFGGGIALTVILTLVKVAFTVVGAVFSGLGAAFTGVLRGVGSVFAGAGFPGGFLTSVLTGAALYLAFRWLRSVYLRKKGN